MSKIDNANISLTLASAAVAKLYIFAVNLNVFRVRSGMGGVAYNSWSGMGGLINKKIKNFKIKIISKFVKCKKNSLEFQRV
jgi:hypothetical protein